MTQESSRRIFAHRKAWLGAGIAAAAAVVVAQVAFDFPIAKDVTGTVIPAQRYRAAQNGSEQVQVGTPAGQVAPTGAAPEGGRSFAEEAAAEHTVSVSNANQMQTGLTADRAAAELRVDRSAELRVDRSAELRVDRAAELRADRAAELKVDRAAADMTMQRNSADKTSIDRSAQQ